MAVATAMHDPPPASTTAAPAPSISSMPYSTANTATVADDRPVKPRSGNYQNDDNSGASPSSSKYHALVIDSGAIIKQTSFSTWGGGGGTSSPSGLLGSASNYYTVPSVLSEIRDPKSRKHFDDFQFRLKSLYDSTLITRLPSKGAIAAVSAFARKTGDFNQLSNVDLQVLALTYDLEVEASKIYEEGRLDHVRREPKRVLGVDVRALNGDDGRRRKDDDGKAGGEESVASGGGVTSVDAANNSASTNDGGAAAFFRGDADGIIDAARFDVEYDDDDGDKEERPAVDNDNKPAAANGNDGSLPSNVLKPKKTWALLVNPERASTAPMVNYSLPATVTATASPESKPQVTDDEHGTEETTTSDANASEEAAALFAVDGQFDDASESSHSEEGEDDHEDGSFSDGSDGELEAIDIANAASDDEFSDEECDVFVLEPHEAAYFKKLKEEKEKAAKAEGSRRDLAERTEPNQQAMNEQYGKEDEGLDSEFPTLAAAAVVLYEGSDDEAAEDELTKEEKERQEASWQKEEEERKKKALQAMVNGRVVDNKKYNSFRKYKGIVSASGAAAAKKEKQKEELLSSSEQLQPSKEGSVDKVNAPVAVNGGDGSANNREYKSRIIGAAGFIASSSDGADFSAEMTAEDDDGEGWVTCTRDIQTMKATGSLHLHGSNSQRPNGKNGRPYHPRSQQDRGPPIAHRVACATTDFAMQNVILQMGLDLLSVDGVRVRRLKTWVTRCGACFTIYGNDDGQKSIKGATGGRRLFCDRCGSDALHRIAASVDRNTGRLKLHLKKNYQYNTRGTKYSLPKAGKGNKYEGDLLLAEDQLLYGAWSQKVRKGGGSSSKSSSIFGSDLASDLGCMADPTRRDDIRVGFGRRNPNASKFGRERRGKKKKNVNDKACGLRRY